MNRFSLYGPSGLRVDVVKATNGGFRVCVMVLPGGDEMWESLTHTALLTKPEADRLRDTLAAAGVAVADGPSGSTWSLG